MKELRLLTHSGHGAGYNLKKAIVLTSDEMVNDMVADAKQLKECEPTLTTAATKLIIDHDQIQRLQRAEDRSALVAQQVLARHERVQQLLLQYSNIVHTLSEKCIHYDKVVTLLEQN